MIKSISAANNLPINLIFHRHGDHEEIPGIDPKDYPLTPKGIEDIRQLSKQLGDLSNARAFTVRNLRSRFSSALLLNPHTSKDSLDATVDILEAAKRLSYLDVLQYREVRNPKFLAALAQAVQGNDVLRFLVEDSDRVASISGNNVSTYASMGRDIAALICEYVAVDQVNFGTSSPQIFCTREFIYACFRTRITEVMEGKKARKDFMLKYLSNPVSGDDKLLGRLEVTPGAKTISLKDKVGDLIIDANSLLTLAKNPEVSSRVGVYWLPVRVRSAVAEVCLVKYPDGYGFIGGGIEDSETNDEAFKREVNEELGLVDAEIISNALNITSPYGFVVRGKDGKVHTETHWFKTSLINADLELTLLESGAELEWVTISDLIRGNKITFNELKVHLQKYFVPVISKLIP